MFFLNIVSYKKFLESVSQGLAGTSTRIYLALIFLAVFIFIIILISKITKYKERIELNKILNKKYNFLIKDLKVDRNEKQIPGKESFHLNSSNVLDVCSFVSM